MESVPELADLPVIFILLRLRDHRFPARSRGGCRSARYVPSLPSTILYLKETP